MWNSERKKQILKNPLYKAVHPWDLINQAYASLMSHWRIQVFPRESNRNSTVTKHSKYLGLTWKWAERVHWNCNSKTTSEKCSMCESRPWRKAPLAAVAETTAANAPAWKQRFCFCTEDDPWPWENIFLWLGFLYVSSASSRPITHHSHCHICLFKEKPFT